MTIFSMLTLFYAWSYSLTALVIKSFDTSMAVPDLNNMANTHSIQMGTLLAIGQA